MMKKIKLKRIIEWAKTAVIVLLTVSAFLLGWQTGQFDDLVSAVPLFGSVAEFMRGTPEDNDDIGISIKEAARPIAIVITNDEGARYGAKYDTALRNDIYDRTSSIIGEALGTASEPVRMTQPEWRDALLNPGIYFEYAMPVKLSILYGWLGARMPDYIEDISVRRIFVSLIEDRNKIYYIDADGGYYYGAETASTAGSIQEMEMLSTGIEVKFAYETDISAAVYAPYMLLMPGNVHPNLNAVSGGSPDELMDLTLSAIIGYDVEAYTPYIAQGGTLVRVGTQFNIRADVNGRVFYRSAEITQNTLNDGQNMSVGELIEIARVVVSDSIEVLSGNAEAFFESIEMISQDTYAVNFSYYISGGRIYLNEGDYAARVTLVNGFVSEAEFIYRSYAYLDDFTSLYMERQAFAAANGEFMLYYADMGTDFISPMWVKTENREGV